MTSNLSGVTGNPATSNAITMTVSGPVTPAVTIAQTTGTNPACAGVSVTFTATPSNGGTPSYQWKVNGTNVGTNSATYSTTTLTNGSVVSCVMTSSLTCATTATATSNSITMSINASVTPAISIAQTSGTNPAASGSSVTFTATATNGGTTPAYQWKVNGTNVGTNSATYTTTTLTNGAIVTCVLTSNATCAVPTTATSNSITMSITGGTVSYCAASTTNTTTTYEYIKKVVCGFSKTSSSSSYSNFTTTSTGVVRGATRTFTVTLGTPFSTDRVIIWVDWNNNGSFTDAGETVYTSALGVGPFSGSFVVPTTAALGAVRMRIRLTDTASGVNETPCGVSTYGEVEDYTLNVAAAGIMQPDEEIATPTVRIADSDVSLEAEVLNVYPNPSRGQITVRSNHAGNYYLMSESGQLVQAFVLNSDNKFTYEISGIAAGFYVVSGQNEFGISKQKVVVTN